MTVSTEARIREIVREEISAHDARENEIRALKRKFIWSDLAEKLAALDARYRAKGLNVATPVTDQLLQTIGIPVGDRGVER